MLAIKLQDSKLETRLKHLAEETGRTENALVVEALQDQLDDLEDLYTVIVRSQHPGRLYSPDEVKREVGL